MTFKQNLQPQQLDIEITKITPKTVTYDLTFGGQSRTWKVPNKTTFNRSQLQVGVRYKVVSKVIMSLEWDHKAQQYTQKERYDWVTAVPQPANAKCASRTKSQTAASKQTAAMTIVGTDLFQF